MAGYTSTKSQIWSLDLIVGIMIFLGAIFLFYKYSTNLSNLQQEDVNTLIEDAKVVSSYLVSEGYPADWGSDNVTMIGLAGKEHTLDRGKLQAFDQMAQADYQNTKAILSTKNDFFVFLEDKEGNIKEIAGVYWIGKNYSIEDPKDIIRVYRFLYYNSSILRMGIYLW